MGERKFEPSDIEIPIVVASLAALFFFLIVSSAAIYAIFIAGRPLQDPGEPPLGQERAGGSEPGPHLQASAQSARKRIMIRQSGLLNGSGWVDRSRDIAHIPVEDAMKLYLSGRWQALADRDELPAERERAKQWEALYGTPDLWQPTDAYETPGAPSQPPPQVRAEYQRGTP